MERGHAVRRCEPGPGTTPPPRCRVRGATSGHRTTYRRLFNRSDELVEGDLLTLETPVATHTYRVTGGFGGHGNP